MKHITFYLDFISPYAYLAFERLPQALEGISHEVRYTPVVFGALLKHHGQLGPAEMAGKREWTYRQVLWLAHQLGVPLHMPLHHPFPSLDLLRLSVAAGSDGLPGRWVCEQVFHHVWHGGRDAADPQRLAELAQQLNPLRDPQSVEVKQQLRQFTDAAIAQQVFGVPTFVVDDKVFWGLDALPMLRAYLLGDAWFDAPHWDEVERNTPSITRQPR